jgi:serine/threonine protein kinase
MTPDRWTRVAALLEQALELDGEQRRAWLEAISSVDLRRDVEQLLSQSTAGSGGTRAEGRRLAEKRLGTRVGPYRLEGVAGGGGQGWVYRAVHEALGLEVAVKALPPEYARDPDRQERLRREGRALASLDDEGIARVHDMIAQGDEVFLVTEFVHGMTLAERLRSGPLPLAEALDYAAQMLTTLGRAHGKGIVHRDLKPANVMVTIAGHVKLLDFGLARLLPGSDGPTEGVESLSRGVVGTVAYMSPEQLRGPHVDHRSDIFAFGVLLYEAVSGVHPFGEATSWSIVGHIERDEPRPLDAARPGLPAWLSEVIVRCLRKRPEDRYQSAGQLAADLARQRAPRTEGEASDAVRWWQFHQVAASTAYAAMVYPLWLALEVLGSRGLRLSLFFTALAAAVVSIALRLFLRFAWRHYRDAFGEEWAWVAPVLKATDTAYTGLLLAGAAAVIVSGGQPVGLGVLLFVFGLALVVAYLRIEPAACRAAFGARPPISHQGAPPHPGSGRLGA